MTNQDEITVKGIWEADNQEEIVKKVKNFMFKAFDGRAYHATRLEISEVEPFKWFVEATAVDA